MPGLTILGNTYSHANMGNCGCGGGASCSCAHAGYSMPRRSSLMRYGRAIFANACGCGCGGKCSKCKKRFQDSVKTIMRSMPYGINIPSNMAVMQQKGQLSNPGFLSGTMQGEDKEWIKLAWESIKSAWQVLIGDECKRKCDLKYPFNRSKRRTCKCLCAKARPGETTYDPPGDETCWETYNVDVFGTRDGLAPKSDFPPIADVEYFNKPFAGYSSFGTEVRLSTPINAEKGGTLYISGGTYGGAHRIQEVSTQNGKTVFVFIDKKWVADAPGVTTTNTGVPILYPTGIWASTVPFTDLPADQRPKGTKKAATPLLIGLGLLLASQA